MKLSKICEGLEYICLKGSMDIEIADIIYDSGKVTEHTAFVCMVGAVTDGHDYIKSAIEKGASALVVEREPECDVPEGCTVIKTESTRYALALMSASYFGHPAEELVTIGLTGTKGKTTTTYMIKSVLEEAGKKVGLIGTIGALIGEEKLPAKNTTPESYELHKMFRAMADAGCDYVVMEVSSQGLKMDRVAGITFDYGIFTNLSPDHIGPAEHASFEEYAECKSILFRHCKTGIINIDDEHAQDIMKGHTCGIKTLSVKQDADLMAGAIGYLDEEGQIGMHFTTTGCMNVYAAVHVPGSFSVYNSLVTMLTCHLAGIDDEAILRGLDKAKVKGRVELVPVSKDFTVIIDYAHNEVSTRSVLTTLKEYHPKRMICVYGGGGNRSKLRRYDMGEVTGELADLCVLTCDNPRDEEIADINNDIKIGLAKSNGKYIEIEDRKEAIRYCIENAKKGDMIVLLGKGHEDYQEIKGVKYHFDEREAIAEIKQELGLS